MRFVVVDVHFHVCRCNKMSCLHCLVSFSTCLPPVRLECFGLRISCKFLRLHLCLLKQRMTVWCVLLINLCLGFDCLRYMNLRCFIEYKKGESKKLLLLYMNKSASNTSSALVKKMKDWVYSPSILRS